MDYALPTSAFTGAEDSFECGAGEFRCIVISDNVLLQRRVIPPSSPGSEVSTIMAGGRPTVYTCREQVGGAVGAPPKSPAEGSAALCPTWRDWLRLLPPSWYRFVQKVGDGRYHVLKPGKHGEGKSADGHGGRYPTPFDGYPRGKESVLGFHVMDMRVMVRPAGWRLWRATALQVALRSALGDDIGDHLTTDRVQGRGLRLRAETWQPVASELDVLCPPGGAEAASYCDAFRSALIERHAPASTGSAGGGPAGEAGSEVTADRNARVLRLTHLYERLLGVPTAQG